QKNLRPTINSYMSANANAITQIAVRAQRYELAAQFRDLAEGLRSVIVSSLWDANAQFFKVMLEDGTLSDAREAIGFIPWIFNLPDEQCTGAWAQLVDPEGFWAPFGIMTAERRH